MRPQKKKRKKKKKKKEKRKEIKADRILASEGEKIDHECEKDKSDRENEACAGSQENYIVI